MASKTRDIHSFITEEDLGNGQTSFRIDRLLRDPEYLFETLHYTLVTRQHLTEYDIVCGIGTMGGVIASTISTQYSIPLTLIRHDHITTNSTRSVLYELDGYHHSVEVEHDSIKEGGRILIVDDVLTSGEVLVAAISLVNTFNPSHVDCLCFLEQKSLRGRDKLKSKHPTVGVYVCATV